MPYLDTEPCLPFAPRSHTSWKAARQAQASRATKTAAYLRCLREAGPLSDHDAAIRLGLPLSSICSIRNGVKAQLVKDGTAMSPYGRVVDCWRVA